MSIKNYLAFANDYAKAHHINIDTANETSIANAKLQKKQLRKEISFTPYIYNSCSATCRFCSETISRKTNGQILFPTVSAEYHAKLQNILSQLQEVDIFLSISGVEPLESLDFLESVLTTFGNYESNGGRISKKVIYSNLSAMVHSQEHILELISRFGIDRVETSRHHYNQDTNQQIVRFTKKQAIQSNTEYVNAVTRLRHVTDVKLACVLQQTGVNSTKEVANYLDWAGTIPVHSVTFRELSLIDKENFSKNRTMEYIAINRVSILSILPHLSADFQLLGIEKGYYYLSFNFLYKGKSKVSFEVADYGVMIKEHNSKIINKLIYYPNAYLCMDWNMQQRIL